MSTSQETVDFILHKLGNGDRFRVRKMFGEYAMYADDKVVALICDDQLYVKIMPESGELEEICEKDAPYDGAKPHYLIEEDQLSHLASLPHILLHMAEAIPKKKKKRDKQIEW